MPTASYQESQKARLFTAVVFENLEQDIARGNGEYLTSLGVLLKIPEGEQDEFRARSLERISSPVRSLIGGLRKACWPH